MTTPVSPEDRPEAQRTVHLSFFSLWMLFVCAATAGNCAHGFDAGPSREDVRRIADALERAYPKPAVVEPAK